MKFSLGKLVHSLPVVGPIAESLGLIGPSDEEKALQQKLKDNAAQMEAYRPQYKAAGLEILRRQLGLYGPVNDMITKMYGPEFRFNLDGLASDPFQYDVQNGLPFNPQGNSAPVGPVQVPGKVPQVGNSGYQGNGVYDYGETGSTPVRGR
jgi:hypothetical protein